MVLGDGLVDELVHCLIEAIFVQLFPIRLAVQGAIGLVSEALQFLSQDRL